MVNTPAHQQLALEAAEQSLVLLKNDGNALPWKPTAGMKVAVIGRNANATQNMQGNYFGTAGDPWAVWGWYLASKWEQRAHCGQLTVLPCQPIQAPYLVTPLAGIAKFASVSYADGTDIDEAVKVALAADAVVLVVGLTSEGQRPGDETEGHDRSSLLLPLNQDAMVAAVAAAVAGKGKTPPAVVTMNGGPLDLSAIKANAKTPSLVWCGYPGQSGGDAIAKVG